MKYIPSSTSDDKVSLMKKFCHFSKVVLMPTSSAARIVTKSPVPPVATRLASSWPWWRHQMETFSALLALYAGNSPVIGEIPPQRPVTRSFDVIFDLHLNKWLSKQAWGWWYETPTCPLWRHCNEVSAFSVNLYQCYPGDLRGHSVVIL